VYFGLFGHRITLSALASTFGGIVRPICFAVLRLITNSNFVRCPIGKSTGFSPLKIFSWCRPDRLTVRKLRLLALRCACLVDRGQRKKTADIAEKLGVGLLLGTMVQGIFGKDLSYAMYGIGATILAIAFVLIVFAIYISREE
jgi:hypothetical protein